MNYRKAMFSDIDDISYLVTNLLGTCNINKNNISVSKIDILNNNKKEIIKDINNYYVCEINNHIVGACGISNIKKDNAYNINLGKYREILYLVVDDNYQKQGIGTKLLQLCCDNIKDKIIYEAWGDGKEVNSKYLLEKCNFELLKNLGDTYYKDKGYCSYCVNRNKKCNTCKAELWIKK
jgi:N-acetylglutamate synthase-like GNAT family acetyltransferase